MMVAKLVLVVAGVITHLCFFNRGEHHMYGLRYLQIFLLVVLAAILCLVCGTGATFRRALDIIAPGFGLYFTGLYASLAVYRIFYHPLKTFPGPFSARLSSLSFSTGLLKLDAHRKVAALHERYGDFVRVGSSDLSIVHPKAPEAIYGRRSRCVKSDWYDLTLPMTSMQTTRSRTEHDKRRRIWGGAFNDTILRSYEARIAIYQDQLLARIASAQEQAINATELFHQFAFDVMGDLSFGVSFNMLQSQGNHWAIKLLRRGMEPLGLMFPTWCFRLLLSVPGATGDWFAFKDYCCRLLDDRFKTHVTTPNITSFLIGPWQDKTPRGYDLDMLQGDSQLIIVAGSDTTATTMACIFYELASNSEHIPTLRSELANLQVDDLTNQKLQNLEHLNGVINETLRLHSPAGLALQRKTPPEGLMIGDTYVPGGMTVWCPQYILGKSDKVYEDPLAFRPERWCAKSSMIKETSAYAPFSLGTYNCIGKPLALMMLRTSVAKLILRYDIDYGPKEDGSGFMNKARTNFITQPGPLHLRFRKRG